RAWKQDHQTGLRESGTAASSKLVVQRRGNSGHGRIDHLVAQGLKSILQAESKGKAFFISFQPLTTIFVENVNGVYKRRGAAPGPQCVDFVKHSLSRNPVIHDERQVASDLRIP